MKKSMNRFVCGLTAAVMMGTLTACSGGQGETKPAAPAGSESAGNSESAAQQGEAQACLLYTSDVYKRQGIFWKKPAYIIRTAFLMEG